MSFSSWKGIFKALKAQYQQQLINARLWLATTTDAEQRETTEKYIAQLDDPYANGYCVGLRRRLCGEVAEVDSLRSNLNNMRDTNVTPDDHVRVARKVLETNTLEIAARSLTLWNWLFPTGLRGHSFANARLGHLSHTYTLYTGRPHTTEPRVFSFNTWRDKTNPVGKRVEKGVLVQANPLTCPIFSLGVWFFYTWQIAAHSFPDLLGKTWHAIPVLWSSQSKGKALHTASHRNVLTNAYNSLHSTLSCKLHAGRQAIYKFLQGDPKISFTDLHGHVGISVSKTGDHYRIPQLEVPLPAELEGMVYPELNSARARVNKSRRGDKASRAFADTLTRIRRVFLAGCPILQRMFPRFGKYRLFGLLHVLLSIQLAVSLSRIC